VGYVLMVVRGFGDSFFCFIFKGVFVGSFCERNISFCIPNREIPVVMVKYYLLWMKQESKT